MRVSAHGPCWLTPTRPGPNTTDTARTDAGSRRTAGTTGARRYGDTDVTAPRGHDTSGRRPRRDDASEERLHVGTEVKRERPGCVSTSSPKTSPRPCRSATRRYVEREPITEANRGAAMSGGDLTEEEHEVTLHAERPVVERNRPGRAGPAGHRDPHRAAPGQRGGPQGADRRARRRHQHRPAPRPALNPDARLGTAGLPTGPVVPATIDLFSAAEPFMPAALLAIAGILLSVDFYA